MNVSADATHASTTGRTNTGSTAALRWDQIKDTPNLEKSGSTNHPLLADLKSDPLWLLNEAEGNLVEPEILSNLIFVRNFNRKFLGSLESQAQFAMTPWTKEATPTSPGDRGGGVISLLRGKDIEKSAVNMSIVRGEKYPSIESEYAGKPFTACGVSLICHCDNPYAPIAHMNVRILKVGTGSDAVTWIGGGGDLTPMLPFPEDTAGFHDALRLACEANPLGDYPAYRKWCDEYFFIPHRGQTRGVGGIFFDYVKIKDPAQSFFLVQVGTAFARAYAEILGRRLDSAYTAEQKEAQLYWRGRYAEFNLVYDRGTRFGLMSGGNTEAIFGSLPPVVKW
jgi:coproporphyrinogen III oxidase